jgi:hypothetical protein
MRYLFIVGALLSASCTLLRDNHKIDVRFEEVCVEGILYLKFIDAVTVKYSAEEVIEHCLED